MNAYNPQSINEQAIADLYRELLASWNKRNAIAYAKLVAENGNLIGFDGSQLDGRLAIESSMKAIFDNHPTASYVSKIREIRKLSENTYMLRAVVGMVPPGKTDINPEVNAIQSLIAIKTQGEGWEIVLFQNTPAQFHGRPEAADALTRELKEEILIQSV